MSQVQAATNMALDFPDRYPQLYAFLTEGAMPKSSTPGTTPTEPSVNDAELWRQAVAERAKPTTSPAGSLPDAAPSVSPVMRKGAEARARPQNLVARQLDALQTEVFYRWARTNQSVATVAGTALSLIVLLPAKTEPGSPNFVLAVALAFVAGLTAPFAKDVVSGLSAFSRGSKT